MPRRSASLLLPLAALGLAFGIACGGGDSAGEGPAEAASLPSETATSRPSETTGPTATPTPYDGPVTRLMIPRFGVDTPVEQLGVTPDNYLDTPANPLNSGWYGNGLSDLPGWSGNATFSAHYNQLIGGNWHDGPFKHLKEMAEGDQIVVVMGNGDVYRYEMVSYARYEEATFPTGELLAGDGKPEGEEWITLITCGGRTGVLDSRGVGDFLDRDVVIARRIDNKRDEESAG